MDGRFRRDPPCRDRLSVGQLNSLVRGKAAYVEGELHRLRGDLAAAESAYRTANSHGLDPQPGMALLRLAEGNPAAAVAAITRAIAESTQTLHRIRLLPAYTEIMVAAGEFDRARAAVDELDRVASHQGEAVEAMATHSRGILLLAVDDAAGALGALLNFDHGALRSSW